jgi:hypothetical protein
VRSLYWVFTLRCNDRCEHCYNDSSPTGEALPTEELLRVVPNLPAELGALVLSGGEPTVEMEKLAAIVGAVRARYGRELPVVLQTNGDLLDAERAAALEAMEIDFLDVVSMDRFHKQQGAHREQLEELFRGRGWTPREEHRAGTISYRFWGATEELWLKGNWARGRAIRMGHAKLDPEHNFCALWSGARGFLDEGSDLQEVHVQLTRVYPCCPTTFLALGDAREEAVEDILERYREHPDWQALNRGEPAELGVDPAHARARIQELGDVCLWCDEYLRETYRGPAGEARQDEHKTPFDV